MRGEEACNHAGRHAIRELPPHARRRVISQQFDLLQVGITSACAEKRSATLQPSIKIENYLRMRGEEASDRVCFAGIAGLPPHARRREDDLGFFDASFGITSACAEKR